MAAYPYYPCQSSGGYPAWGPPPDVSWPHATSRAFAGSAVGPPRASGGCHPLRLCARTRAGRSPCHRRPPLRLSAPRLRLGRGRPHVVGRVGGRRRGRRVDGAPSAQGVRCCGSAPCRRWPASWVTGAAASWCGRLGDRVARRCRRLLGFPLSVLDCRTTGCRRLGFPCVPAYSPAVALFFFAGFALEVLTVLLSDRRFLLDGGRKAVVHSAAPSPVQREDRVRPHGHGVRGVAGGDR